MLFLLLASLIPGMDDPPAPGRLPGSDIPVAQAERQALYIVEARFVSLGRPREEFGQVVYTQAIIKPSKVVKARGNAAIRQVRVQVREHETAPALGEAYTLHIRLHGRGLEVFRVARLPEQKPK